MNDETRADLREAAVEINSTPGRVWPLPAAVSLVTLALLLITFRGTVVSLGRTWLDVSSYSHGFLVLAISAYLVWRDRARLVAAVPVVRFSGILLVLVLSVGWAVADVLDINIGRQLSVYLLLAAIVWTFLGPRVLRVLAFPLGYLSLAIPIWSELTTTLQQNTADAASWLLTALGVPIFHEGFYLTIPSGRFEVAEVCAGLRFFLAALSIATLYGYLNLRRNLLRVALVAIAAVAAIVFNWLRVDVIVWAGYVSEMQSSLVHSHIWFGWFMFVLGLGPVLVCGAWFERFDSPARQAPVAGSATPPAGAGSRVLSHALIWPLCIMALLAGPGLAARIGQPGTGTVLRQFPPLSLAAPWRELKGGLRDWSPSFAGPTLERGTRYAGPRGTVSLYLAYFQGEQGGSELISSENRVFNRKRWQPVGESVRTIRGDSGQSLAVNEVLLRSAARGERLVWYWYFVAGTHTRHRLAAKALEFRALLGGLRGGVLVAVSTPAGVNADQARETLAGFVRDTLPELERGLASPRAVPD